MHVTSFTTVGILYIKLWSAKEIGDMSKLELYCFVILSIVAIGKAPVYVYNLIHYVDIPYIQLDTVVDID
jgi:hypothetical protein